jgi:hypothetical protein
MLRTVSACGSGTVEALAAHPLAAAAVLLPTTRGDVVGAAVTEHVVERVGLADVACRAADDHPQFGLEIDLGTVLAGGRQDDRRARVVQRRVRFHEHHRAGRHVGPGLVGMGLVVEADAEDVDRLDRCQQGRDRGALPGRRQAGVGVAGEQLGAVLGLAQAVVGGAGGVDEADEAHGSGSPFAVAGSI